MAILRNTIFLLALSVLTGCYEEFDPKIDTTPVLAINSMITAGEPIEVQLSHTWVYNDAAASVADHSVTDADLQIFVNGNLADDSYIAREGDKVRIVADSRKYGHAEAEVTVPRRAVGKILSADPHLTEISHLYEYEHLEMDADIRFDLSIEVEVDDDASHTEWYMVDLAKFVGDEDIVMDRNFWDPYSKSRLSLGYLDYNAEPIFSEHVGAFETVMGSGVDGFSFFTDRRFSGSDYKLRLVFKDAWYNVSSDVYDESLFDCGYKVLLESISQSCYNWNNYKWQSGSGTMGDYADFGLSDPVWGYSNVSTGAGVVMARCITVLTVPVTSFIRNSYDTLE